MKYKRDGPDRSVSRTVDSECARLWRRIHCSFRSGYALSHNRRFRRRLRGCARAPALEQTGWQHRTGKLIKNRQHRSEAGKGDNRTRSHMKTRTSLANLLVVLLSPRRLCQTGKAPEHVGRSV